MKKSLVSEEKFKIVRVNRIFKIRFYGLLKND